MTNNDEWYWEEGDSFTIKSSNDGPYTVTEVLPTYLCFTTKDGAASSVIKSNAEPYIPEKLRKFITLVEPWAPDPEDELLERAARLYEEASSDSMDNELVTADEAKLGTDIIRFIAEGKSRNPAELAASLALIHDLNFKRY